MDQKDVAGPIWGKIATRERDTTPEEKRRIIAICDSTVSYNDDALGKLLAALASPDCLPSSPIVAGHDRPPWVNQRPALD